MAAWPGCSVRSQARILAGVESTQTPASPAVGWYEVAEFLRVMRPSAPPLVSGPAPGMATLVWFTVQKQCSWTVAQARPTCSSLDERRYSSKHLHQCSPPSPRWAGG